MKNLILLLIIICMQSCSSEQSVYKKSDSVNYKFISNLPTHWKKIESEGSDYALLNNMTKSIFVFNSSCRKNEGSNLNTLTSSILAGIEQVEIADNKIETLQGRDAKVITASGKLDGVIRFFKIVTIQKNNCIYDYSLIATKKKNLEHDSEDFKNFVNGTEIN